MGRESTLRTLCVCTVITLLSTAMAYGQINPGLSMPTFSSSVGSSFNTLGSFRSYSTGVPRGNYTRGQNTASTMSNRASNSTTISNYSSRQRVNNRLDLRVAPRQTQAMLSRAASPGSNMLGRRNPISNIRPVRTRYSSFSRSQNQLSNRNTTTGFASSYVSRNTSGLSRNPFGSQRSAIVTRAGLSNMRSLSGRPSWISTRR